MGLISYSESETYLSTQEKHEEEIRKETTRDVDISRTVLSPSEYESIYNSLIKYSSGIRIRVDYFNNVVGYSEKQTTDFTFSLLRSDVDISFDLIKNMEIILKGALTEDYNEETGEFTVSGTGIVYPHIHPKIGDIFLYTLINELVGVFVIDGIKRMTLSTNTSYEITFHLYSYLENDLRNKLFNNIRETFYFNKERYFGTDTPIMTKDSFLNYLKIKQLRKRLYHKWVSYFYDEFVGSIVNVKEYDTGETDNNGNPIVKLYKYFDPFVIEFIFNIFDISKVSIKRKKPLQLVGNVSDRLFEQTVFGGLLYRQKDLIDLKYFTLGTTEYSSFQTSITSVINFNIPLLGKDNEIGSIKETNKETTIESFMENHIQPYVLSSYFYQILSEYDGIDDTFDYRCQELGLEEIEIILLKYLLTNDMISIRDELENFLISWTPIESKSFYHIPLTIMLSNVAEKIIT